MVAECLSNLACLSYLTPLIRPVTFPIFVGFDVVKGVM